MSEILTNVAKRSNAEDTDQDCSYNAKKQRVKKSSLAIPVDNHLSRYWKQRYRLFSLFDKGIKLDEESWYSVTPEKIAKHIAKRCRCDIIVDGFCGAGGNTIQFALTCQHVIAVDIDPKKIELAQNNARVYGVQDHIDFICGDFLDIIPRLKADVIFLSPPWGGTSYLDAKEYNLAKIKPNILQVFDLCRKITNNIAFFAPRTTIMAQLIHLAGKDNDVEVEQNIFDHKVKAITAYYGSLVKSKKEK